MIWLGILIAALLIVTAATYVVDASRPSMTPPESPETPLIAGYAVLICHRRAADRTGAALAAEWGPARARLVARHREAIGFGAYMQVHQVSRLNLLYNVIRISRAWPVAALFSILHGLPVPRLHLSDPERDAEDWDVIESFEFPDAEAAHRFLAGVEAEDARKALDSDAAPWTRRRQAVPMQIARAHAGAPAGDQMAYTIYCLRARAHLGRAGMVDYWLHRHRPYVLSLHPILRFGAYDQLVARDAERLEEEAHALSHAAGGPWDGVAVLGYRTMGEIWQGLVNPRIQRANVGLVSDETRFVDVGRSSLMLGRMLHRL